jgi:hypothetical protein
VLYEIRVDNGTRFEREFDKPPAEGTYFTQVNMTYEVLRVLPEEAAVDVAWKVGPAQAGYEER